MTSKLRVKLGEAEFESQGEPNAVSLAFGAFTCWLLRKHLRGKAVDRKEDFEAGPAHLISPRTHQTFQCPRCGREKKYKFKASSVTPTKAAG